MTAEVYEVMAQLAIIQREIIDPLSNKNMISFDNAPYTISVADMPLFVNFPGPLNMNQLAGSDEKGREFNETRIYTMNLFHSAVGTGIEGEKIGLLTPYFHLVYNKFGQYPHLKALAGVMDAKLIADSGINGNLQFSGQKYFGIRFSLQVLSRTRRTLGEGD
jgi:hypothetical protein